MGRQLPIMRPGTGAGKEVCRVFALLIDPPGWNPG
jgi:hypothetical protein